MKGTKRFALSGLATDTNDSAFRYKRIIAGSPFDAQRAEPSQQQSTATPPLDPHWVQSQQKNHPDEHWQDGVQDYLTHASNIMEKLDLLPISTTTGFSPGNTTLSFSPGTTARTFSLGTTSTSPTSADMTKKFSPVDTTTSFTSASSTTSLTPAGMTTGTEMSGAVNNNASEDVDDVKKSEEKGIVVVHEVKCKLYVKSTDPADKDSWKDKGTGQLSIKCKEGISKGSKDSKPTIVVRHDVGKALLNALLYPGIKTSAQKNSLVAIFHTSSIYLKAKYLDILDIQFSNFCILCCSGQVTLHPLPGAMLTLELTSVDTSSILRATTFRKNARDQYRFHFTLSDLSWILYDDGGNNDNAVAHTFLIRTKSEED
ncbi:hypothetical protein CRYUN_Cryun13aG0124500 [Craigia yunnanensis]